jgi:diketogulonate reductase-like aldo/keto reductase
MCMRHNVKLLHGRCIVVLHYRWDYRDVHYFDSMKLLYTLKLEGKIKEPGLTNFDTVPVA